MIRTEVGITTDIKSSLYTNASSMIRETEVGITTDFNPETTANINSLSTEIDVGIETWVRLKQ